MPIGIYVEPQIISEVGPDADPGEMDLSEFAEPTDPPARERTDLTTIDDTV